MALLTIRKFPDPILKKPARKIRKGEIEDFQALVSDMAETMITEAGVGLAAPQVGLSLRVFVVLTADDEGEVHSRAFVNPQVLEREGYDLGEEGCLSFPSLYGMVERPTWIKLKFLDEEFSEHVEEFEGLPARIILHELDHLDGILLNDRTDELYEHVEEEEESGEYEDE